MSFARRLAILAVAASLGTLCVAFVAIAPADASNPFRRSDFVLRTSDRQVLGEAARSLYLNEAAVPGDTATWRNPETGTAGTATFLGDTQYRGLPCRRVEHDIAIRGLANRYVYFLDYCRTADGSWKVGIP